jgi:hypothetical protein
MKGNMCTVMPSFGHLVPGVQGFHNVNRTYENRVQIIPDKGMVPRRLRRSSRLLGLWFIYADTNAPSTETKDNCISN